MRHEKGSTKAVHRQRCDFHIDFSPACSALDPFPTVYVYAPVTYLPPEILQCWRISNTRNSACLQGEGKVPKDVFSRVPRDGATKMKEQSRRTVLGRA